MPKTLFLMRHGKAGDPEAAIEDAARALTKRGRDAAWRIGLELARRGTIPQLVLCSTARRTRETYDHLCEGLGEGDAGAPAVRFEDELYLASAETLLLRVRSLDGDPASVMVIGHNPGMPELAQGLAGGGGKALRGKLGSAYPTGALAVIGFPIAAWAGLAPHGGKLLDFVLPRELE